MSRKFLHYIPVLALLLAFTSHASAAEYIFTNIADSTMAAPVGTLKPLSDPSVRNGVVAFDAQYAGGSMEGIFTGTGGPLTVIVKEGDAAPTGVFSEVGGAFIGSSGVAFLGRYDNGKEGIFVASGGALNTIAKTGDASPQGSFIFLNPPAASGNNVAFLARATGGDGIYVGSGGPLTTIAKTGDLLPTGQQVSSVGGPALSGNAVAFNAGYSGGNGIFVGNGGPLTKIIQTGDPAPIGTYAGGSSANISGNVVAFTTGYGPPGPPNAGGVFIGSGGPISPVALVGNPAPIGTFDSVGGSGFFGNTMLLNATYGGFQYDSLFLNTGASSIPVIKTGDPLFGSTLGLVGTGDGGLDRDGSGRIAFFYSLAD
jgi:hypothetical protein